MIQNCRIIARTVAHTNIFSTSFNYQLTRTFKKNVISQARIIENVPVLGESITEGSIASWSKNIGDSVAIDDVIVIIETDKVTVDIKSTHDGILTAYLADDTVRNFRQKLLIRFPFSFILMEFMFTGYSRCSIV
jgi:acetyl/propionyl-CoA carboxylase alpha subunit